MDHFAEYSGVVLMILVGAFGLFGHWLACMWFAIGINTICDNNILSGHNWLVRFASDTNQSYDVTSDCLLTGGPHDVDAYLAALYFVMSSLTSVGFGNIAAYSLARKSYRTAEMIGQTNFHGFKN